MKKIYLLIAVVCMFAFTANAQPVVCDGWIVENGETLTGTFEPEGIIRTVFTASSNDNNIWRAQLITPSWKKIGKEGDSFKLSFDVMYEGSGANPRFRIASGKTFPWSADFQQGNGDFNTQIVDQDGNAVIYDDAFALPAGQWVSYSYDHFIGELGADSIRLEIDHGCEPGTYSFRNFVLEVAGKIVAKYFSLNYSFIDNIIYDYNYYNYRATVIGIDNSQITSLTIPSAVEIEGKNYSVTGIDANAFSGCRGLTSVTIPNSVTSIGNSAFSDCNGLTSVTIPNSVTSIGNSAFANCNSLTSVTIPNSVTSIGNNAFANCNSLTSVTTNCAIIDRANLYITKDNIRYRVLNKNDVEVASNNNPDLYSGEVVIPATISAGNAFVVTSIGSSAFYNCSGLTEVTIGNSVTSIGERAFSGCRGLTSVTIPNSVTRIGSAAFYNCSGLKSIIIGNSVNQIGGSAFSGCNNLTSVCIPDSVTSIGDRAFSGCSGLTSVTIPNSVTSISEYAFSGCDSIETLICNTNAIRWFFSDKKSLKTVILGDSVTSIGNSAFSGCSGLTSVTIPNSVTSIGYNAFSGCSGLTSVTIPNSVKAIWDGTFSNCSGLMSVIIGNSVNQIGGSAFSGCNNLTSVCIPDSVTSIGDRAFSGCSGLTSVTIPKSVTNIDSKAFENCSGLMSIVIPNTVTSIGASAFKDCVNLTIYCQAKVKHTGWSDQWNINECPVVWGAQLVNVNIAVNNSAYGQVSGMGAYIDSAQVKILAIPNAGYVFVKWSDGNTENPRTIVASGDLDFTAVFEIDETQNGNNEGNENQGGENTNPSTAVAETAANAINIYAHHNTIIVENATEEIRIYNAMGALVCRDVARNVSTVAESGIRAELQVNGAGVYIVKVGAVAKRVMIND